MSKEQSIEQVYQKKTQLEHILIRPDTYIGSIEMTSAQLWVLAADEEHFEYKQVEYVPGFYKIFDEILVNAADNYQRDRTMDCVKVTIDPEANFISIWNNGKGIPVQIHNTYGVYVPELIFGQLLSGSNYDDTQKKVVGGRNGYGAKLTNIFSKKFVIECGDSKNRKLFKKTWRHNMSSSSNAEITSYDGSDYTCVSWEPDLPRFGMPAFQGDIVAILKKRVYDLAGISKLRVFLNKKLIKVTNFSKYVDFYLTNPSETPKIHDKDLENKRWEVVVSLSDGQFQQVSFVNSICTTRGGTHVDHITNQLVEKLSEAISKKKKKVQIKPHQIRSNLWVFVNCLIENPTFDSQTKETLTLKASDFGSSCQLSQKYIQELLKTEIVQSIIQQAEARENAKLAKGLTASKKSRLLGIPKLDDANDAGTRNAASCTLILTEGDSAKSLAMAGIEVIGRDKYGVFPLRGKMLNVREANNKQILENQEIQNLIKILGLQGSKKYENVTSLRYGSIMIMADQDYDGSHIKGLVINFIHHFWPELVHLNGFLKEFITPILKASKGSEVHSFFTINDFKNWAEGKNLKEWKIKYYKGLGTSTDKEAQEYFNNIYNHQIDFLWQNEQDDDSIDLLFNKKRADDRKSWLQSYDPQITLDHTNKLLRYTDFTNKEMIQFSIADNLRSIPNICDGLKPGQRKILFACFKRNLRNEIKVAQLSGYIAEHSAYHHGEVSLQQTIIGMSQNFVGSNNINLLMPIGQFGTRNQGGKDHASARYIYTNLSKVTRHLFPEPDDHLYNYLEDDGQMVEPEWYLPIIPLSLVNGAEGIGTGWSTFIPCYNPRELATAIKSRLKGEKFNEFDPWYKGFSGEIIKNEGSKGGYTVNGRYDVNEEEETIHITELPIQKWTKDYQVFLEEMVTCDNSELDDLKLHHTNNRVHFIVKPKDFGRYSQENLEKKLKLQTTLQITNMVMFDKNGKLKKYSSVREIFDEFFDLRLEFYDKRKKYLVSKIKRDLNILDNKCRFILAVINGEIKINNVKKKDICLQLFQQGFVQMKEMPKILSTKPQFQENKKAEDGSEVEEDVVPNESDLNKEYSYLLGMPLWSLSYEKVEDLKRDVKKKEDELKVVEKTPLEDMWIKDIDEFLNVLDEVEEEEEKIRLKRPLVKGGGMKKPRANKKKDKDSDEKPKKIKEKPQGNSEKKPKKAEKAGGDSEKKVKIKKQEKPKETVQSRIEKDPKLLPLAERIEAKMAQSSTSFREGFGVSKSNNFGSSKKKASDAIEERPAGKKKFLDFDDDSNKMVVLDMDKENNRQSLNKREGVSRVKKNKNYYESEEEKSDDSSFDVEEVLEDDY